MPISPAVSVRDRSDTTADLLPLCDAAAIGLAALIALAAWRAGTASALSLGASWAQWSALIWTAVIVGPFVLYDMHIVRTLHAQGLAATLRGLGRRLLLLAGIIAVIAYAGRWLDQGGAAWLWGWLSGVVAAAVILRLLFAAWLRRIARDAATAAAAGGAPDQSSPTEERHSAMIGETLSVALLADRPIRRWNAVLKSSKDRLLAMIACVLLSPLLVLIAMAIRIDSRGPILFRQRRHGLNNSEFDIYKFRTMRVDVTASDAEIKQTVRGDPRITRVGGFLRRWSLDELPQLLNVIEGSMSLVGPRPHAVNMRTETRLGHEITDVYLHRHRVRPGITGWSQVNGCRGATDTAEQLRRRIELDLFYVDHWSLLFDLKILSLTTRVVLRATNAY
ncbi:sugar transferase [Sinimarinibacterium flocculans]|uniref:sugar transferase n=1 Tax=Sinimarinibacterium flocculans TaxID=985250 RepID=UPI002493447B|nr:sugar transferase [Sinimarinibacterium flocculans]